MANPYSFQDANDLMAQLAGPVVDQATADYANQVVDVMLMYEKNKPLEGPVEPCFLGDNCPQRFMNCAYYHHTDCLAWIQDRTSCKGTCGKYHRKFVAGRTLTKDGNLFAAANVAVPDTHFVSDWPIFGNVSVGLKWDVCEDIFKGMGGGTRVFAAFSNYKNVDLCAGVFDWNNQLIGEVYGQKKEDSPQPIGVYHTGDDPEGGPQGRSRPGNYGFNELINIDFARIDPRVSCIMIGFCMPEKNMLRLLENAEICLFPTPFDGHQGEPANPLVRVKLILKKEVTTPSYLFGRFLLRNNRWTFVPMRECTGISDTSTLVTVGMRGLAKKGELYSVPGTYANYDFTAISIGKSFPRSIIPMSVKFLAYDKFGGLIAGAVPFMPQMLPDGSTFLMNCVDRKMHSIFIYAETPLVPPGGGDTFFIVRVRGFPEPVIIHAANIGTEAQIIARLTQDHDGRLDITTFSYMLSNPKADAPISSNKDYAAWADSSIRASRLVTRFDRQLVLHVVGGENLVVKDFATSDPYLKIKYGTRTLETDVIKSTLNPQWNYKQELYSDKNEDVKFKCYDWNKIAKHGFMGLVILSAREISEDPREFHLHLSNSPKHPKTKASGVIKVRAHYKWSQA